MYTHNYFDWPSYLFEKRFEKYKVLCVKGADMFWKSENLKPCFAFNDSWSMKGLFLYV